MFSVRDIVEVYDYCMMVGRHGVVRGYNYYGDVIVDFLVEGFGLHDGEDVICKEFKSKIKSCYWIPESSLKKVGVYKGFFVGDRVSFESTLILENEKTGVGTVKKVIQHSKQRYLVEFDAPFCGHDGRGEVEKPSKRSYWFCKEEDLSYIEEQCSENEPKLCGIDIYQYIELKRILDSYEIPLNIKGRKKLEKVLKFWNQANEAMK